VPAPRCLAAAEFDPSFDDRLLDARASVENGPRHDREQPVPATVQHLASAPLRRPCHDASHVVLVASHSRPGLAHFGTARTSDGWLTPRAERWSARDELRSRMNEANTRKTSNVCAHARRGDACNAGATSAPTSRAIDVTQREHDWPRCPSRPGNRIVRRRALPGVANDATQTPSVPGAEDEALGVLHELRSAHEEQAASLVIRLRPGHA